MNQNKKIYRNFSNASQYIALNCTQNARNHNSLYGYIDVIKSDCGSLCNTSFRGNVSKGPFFDYIRKAVNCDSLFKNDYMDKSHNMKYPPKEIPSELMDDFTMNGLLPVYSWYFNEHLLGSQVTTVWNKKMIEKSIISARNNNLRGTYSVSETNALRDGLKHTPGIRNGRVLVIGSRDPWVEACVLEAGAQEVVTLEYGKINCFHGSIKTIVPNDFRSSYKNKTLGMFDAVVTFSSVEHSGLGRYGDALNPWGDIIAIARAWCVTKHGGGLAIGVMFDKMKDYIKFNAGRWYGSVRYPFLTTNWRQLYQGSGKQRVFVFEKEDFK